MPVKPNAIKPNAIKPNAIKPNARSKAIGNVLNSTAETLNTGVKKITTPLVDTLDSMKKSLSNALESNSSSEKKNPIFDNIVPSKGGKRKSKKRKSRKHRKTAKK